MSEIIEQLKNLRQDHQLTALEISQALQTSERNVWRWIHDGNNPSPQAIIAIEKFIKEVRSKAQKHEQAKIERCSHLILDEIYNGMDYVFHARPNPGEKFSHSNYPVGVVRTDRQLKVFSKACGLRLNDPVILKTLDVLASKAQIKIVSIFIPARRNFEHLGFQIEIGEAVRTIPGQDRAMNIVRSYRDKFLSEKEIEANPGILNIQTQVEGIYKRHEDSLKLRYGASGLEKEVELHHENLVDESRLRTAQLRAGNGENYKKRGEKMEGDQRPASEFTEIKQFEKVREFYEEVIENNTDRPLIVYDCNSRKVEIPPHEKRIVLKVKLIKPLPIEDKK